MTIPEFSTVVDLLQYRAPHQPDQTVYTFLQDRKAESDKLSFRDLDQ
ncbi:MAG: hypothetical protein MJA27_24375 [Pseudanabaenales cyanobacterium]|nr:hypothetical protein [Pseudanabaenales cyanobacterium]